VAVAGEADVIVSGDDDLLVLHPFAGIPILSPAAFLRMLDADR
jgi:predicted nucleic acid-binding protein